LRENVEAVCRRLAPCGWGELLSAHGLDLAAHDLGAELERTLENVDRTVAGFEDFSGAGRQGIEPGQPAESLLLHALASPAVTARPDGTALSAYPTLAELEAVENYVFARARRSLRDLRDQFPDAELAVAVMAYEYRPALDTVHRNHADHCFSRTGIARVGTHPARYGAAERGFLAADEQDPSVLRVLPARYAPWLAVELRGDRGSFGPMNFDMRHHFDGGWSHLAPEDRGDADLRFWVPVHKLFSGPECLAGVEVNVELTTGHVNEKLRRLHLLTQAGIEGDDEDLANEPFLLRAGIAELSTDPEHGSGVLGPVPHSPMVEKAEREGAPVTFPVPANRVSNALGPTLKVGASEGDFRRAPEYVHVRHRLDSDGQIVDLNDLPNVLDVVRAGGYSALHYVDFTGDGWLQASCPQLSREIDRWVPAYSLVTAPDFYPDVDQREISEWWLAHQDVAVQWGRPPLTLSDARLLPNLGHPDGRLVEADGVATAIVSMPGAHPAPPTGAQELKRGPLGRHPHLPDAAASIFAPGWDVSVDGTSQAPFMAAYGLGSPFPEDAKLCAALSSFWPAVAPDAGRTFSPPTPQFEGGLVVLRPTAAPLSDEEAGITGTLPWDGVSGPKAVGTIVEYASWNHVDYVQEALEGRFTLFHTSRVTTAQYVARLLAMARAYRALSSDENPDGLSVAETWHVLSFRPLQDGDVMLGEAQLATGEQLEGERVGITLARRTGRPVASPSNHRVVEIKVAETVEILTGEPPVSLVNRAGVWKKLESDV